MPSTNAASNVPFRLPKPTDRHHDQEQHQIKHRKTWREAEQLNCKAAAERGKTGSDGKSQREQPVDIDADRFRHAPIVDGGADLRANIRSLERVPEDGDKHGAERR